MGGVGTSSAHGEKQEEWRARSKGDDRERFFGAATRPGRRAFRCNRGVRKQVSAKIVHPIFFRSCRLRQRRLMGLAQCCGAKEGVQFSTVVAFAVTRAQPLRLPEASTGVCGHSCVAECGARARVNRCGLLSYV